MLFVIVNQDLKKIFGVKYYQKICNYVETIQNVIDTHDIVVFMARKAYCLYKALQSNNLISNNNKCTILSSRAVTYNGIDFSNKKVAIIEDVVILGESLFEIVNEKNIGNARLSIYILACSENFMLKTKNNESNIKFYTSLILDSNELLELATLITNYIIYKMVPYNADYPAYYFEFSNYGELIQCFKEYNICFITELVHCKNDHIIEGVIPVNDDVLCEGLSKEIANESIFKIRVYIDLKENICYLIPIVIFSTLSLADLDKIYTKMFSNHYDEIVCHNYDEHITSKNKLRVLCYSLAKIMLFSYLRKIIEKYDFNKKSLEDELFGFEFFDNSNSIVKINMSIENQIEIDDLVLYNSLGYAYDLLINNLDMESNSTFRTDYISIDDIKERINTVENDPDKLKLLSSLILDVFIDNGVIVPRIEFNENCISRIFKFGEVAKLTAHDFVLFAIVLGEYSDSIKRMLDKTEIEKVSVIFFRNFNNNFDVENNEAEAYRICYSKFGPRISSSNLQYSVSQGQALIDLLISYNYFEKKGEKYNVVQLNQDEKYNKVKNFSRTLFVNKLQKLYEFYVSAQRTKPDSELFEYISSYIRLLTLISIGNNERDRLLSLIAEVDLIKSRTLSKHEDLSIIINKFNSVIDGVLSGIWKYFCYQKEELLNEMLNLMCSASKEDNALLAIDIFWEMETSGDDIVQKKFFREIGEFLYDVAIFNYYLCKFTNSKLHEDYGMSPYKHFLKAKYFNDIHKKYIDIFSRNKSDIEEFIYQHIKEIDKISHSILDKYHIYDSTSSLIYETYSECVAIFNFNDNNKVEKDYQDLRTYVHNNVVIIPCEKHNKEYVLNRICGTLDDVDIKVLYYADNDNNALLCSASSTFYGEKFLEGIHNTISFIQKNTCSSSANEIFILPKKEFERKEFHTEKISFEYVEKYNYQDDNYIYKYYIKETEKMNVTNMYILGNMYNIEQIAGDLNMLQEKCDNLEIQKCLQNAQEAAKNKDTTKLQECFKWLGENAFDFVKNVGTSLLVDLIKGGLM